MDKAQAEEGAMTEAENILTDLSLWIKRRLRELEHRDTPNRRGDIVNSFAFSAVPDWELRQKLEAIENYFRANAQWSGPIEPPK